jgi:hypothetical protein
MKSVKSQLLLLALAGVLLAAGLFVRQRGTALFGTDTDLFAGLASGAATGIVVILVLFRFVKAPPER